MQYISDEIVINYERCGDGPSVILLHGWGCNLGIFKALSEMLSVRYSVYSLDLPGFGLSTEPPAIWGTEDYVHILERFVYDNGIESPALVGHSFGGRLSILYASRNPVSRLVLIDSAGIVPRRSVKYYLKVYSYKFFRTMCTALLPKEKSERILDRYRKKVGSSDYNGASSRMRSVLSKVVNEDLKIVMPMIKAPTLLFWGTADTATPLADALAMEKLIPDAGLVKVDGAGHYSFLENPALFSAVIRNFFKIEQK